MKKFTFNFSFLDRFKKDKQHETEVEQESLEESEYDSTESPEEFAEKSLGGFSLEKFQNDLANEANQANQDKTGSGQFNLEEENFTNAPTAPLAPNNFKFKFPKFGRRENPIKQSKPEKTHGFDKINWNDFVLRLFSPYSRGKIHAVFIIFLVVVVTYLFGKNIALFLNRTPPVVKMGPPPISIPQEKADTTMIDINKITSANLFNVKESDKTADVVVKKDIDSIICLDASTPTALQIKLLDTIVLQDSVKSVASVQVRGSSDLINVREGERLDEMAEVSKINRMKMILKNLQTGDCEYAATESDAEAPMPNLNIVSPQIGKNLFKSMNPNIKNTGNSFKIKRAFRDSMINNMSDVLTQAKAVQITNPDGSLCFKMTEVVAGSIYSQLDIQENDIICNINGKKIDNLNELMSLLGRIKEIDQFQIGLKRNGMLENKEYGFE